MTSILRKYLKFSLEEEETFSCGDAFESLNPKKNGKVAKLSYNYLKVPILSANAAAISLRC